MDKFKIAALNDERERPAIKPYLRFLKMALAAFALLFSALPSGAQDSSHAPAHVLPIQYRVQGGPCGGLHGWQRDRCIRARWRDHRGHREGRRDDSDVGAAIAAGVVGLAVGAIIAGAAKDADDKRQYEGRRR